MTKSSKKLWLSDYNLCPKQYFAERIKMVYLGSVACCLTSVENELGKAILYVCGSSHTIFLLGNFEDAIHQMGHVPPELSMLQIQVCILCSAPKNSKDKVLAQKEERGNEQSE